MAIRDKIEKKVRSQLEPGEEVHAAFPSQTHTQWLMVAGVIPFLIVNRYHCVVVTDRRILVFDSGKLAQANPSKIVDQLPRATQLGPASGLWHKLDLPLGEGLVHKRFHKDIERADALLHA